MLFKKLGLIVLSLVLLFGLTACNGGSDDILYYTATIHVVDVNDDPIVNAEVVVEGETKETDEFGLVNFQNLEGESYYTVSKAGYVDETGTITTDSSTVSVNVTLKVVDEEDPEVNILSPVDDAMLGEDDITIEWEITDDNPYTWELYLGGASNPEVTGNQEDPHSYTFDPASPDHFANYHGWVVFRVEAVDDQDNENTDSVTVYIETRADLLPDNRDGYWPFEINEEGQIVFHVKNQGNSTAPSSTARVIFYKYDDSQVTEDIPTPSLEPGESINLTPVDIPSGVFDPDANFDIIVDVYDDVDEADEDNNEEDCIIIG